MDKKLFAELTTSMEQMGEITRGERAPSREFVVSRLVAITTDGREPEHDTPSQPLDGTPRFRTWNVEETADGLFCGVWEATPGTWRFANDDWEYCRILSGVSVITEEGAAPVTVRAGNSFVLRPGFRGTWQVIETTRKEYVLRVLAGTAS